MLSVMLIDNNKSKAYLPVNSIVYDYNYFILLKKCGLKSQDLHSHQLIISKVIREILLAEISHTAVGRHSLVYDAALLMHICLTR